MEFGRLNQNLAYKASIDAIAGVGPRKLIVESSPGTGKTGIGAICSNTLLHHDAVDAVLWFTPRTCLNEQVVEAYCQKRWRIGSVRRDIRYASDNKRPLLCRGYSGVVQTFDSLRIHGNLYFDFVEKHQGRVLLVLDEMQCLADHENSKTRRNATSLWGKCRFGLGMSGFLVRGDGQRIPLVDYRPGSAFSPPLHPTGHMFPMPHIRYTHRQGIAEGAVRPIESHLYKGEATFEFRGVEQTIAIESAKDSDYARAMDTFLYANDCRAAFAIVREMLNHWEMQCRAWGYRSKFLIIADRIDMARKIYAAFKRQYKLCLATTEDADGDDIIRGFRTGDPDYPGHDADGMVSVGKAYIGLDVPAATHMAFLRNFRTYQYLLQAFMRIARIDPASPLPRELQRGILFAPNDPKMQTFCNWLRNEQDLGLDERSKRGGGGGGGGGKSEVHTRIDAKAGDSVICCLRDDLPSDEVKEIERLQKTNPAVARIPPETIAFLLRHGASMASGGSVAEPAEASPAQDDEVPLQHKEGISRDTLESLCNKAAALYVKIFGDERADVHRFIRAEVMRRGNLPPKSQRSPEQMDRAVQVASQMCSELERELQLRTVTDL